MKLEHALPIAETVKTLIAPYCSRIEIAGSIRRRKPEVGDIEIVCIPALSKSGSRDVRWAMGVLSLGRVIKGSPITGKYIQVVVKVSRQDEPTDSEINVDIFTATPENWGLILAIRTGSASFSHNRLARGWVCNRFYSNNGMIYNMQHNPVPVREEHDLFVLAGVEYVDPEFRYTRGDAP